MATTERKPLSKKMRFDVFKRDLFACQYCGATPPKVVLEVDHITPVSAGGKNQVENLITSCFDCNRGKGAGLLTTIPESVEKKAGVIAEKLAQMKAFNRLVKATEKHEDKLVDEVEEAFQEYHTGYTFSPTFRRSVRLFIQKIPSYRVAEFMHIACRKVKSVNNVTSYFCGICWKEIKGSQK